MKEIKKIEIFLWEKLKTGNVDSLGKIYDNYIDILFSYGIQFSNNKEHVMDCIHDLFLDLYKYRKNLASTDNVKYYLLRSLKRKIYKNNTTLLLKTPLNNKYQQENYTESNEAILISKEIEEEKKYQLAKAIHFLTKKQKKAIFLRFNEGRTYQEISGIMNVSIQTSRTIVYRGIKVLRKQLLFFLIFLKIYFFLK